MRGGAQLPGKPFFADDEQTKGGCGGMSSNRLRAEEGLYIFCLDTQAREIKLQL